MSLEHSLERSVLICAERSTVFRYFTDSNRFARWWGEGSSIEPTPGGNVRICYPNGVIATGTVLELVPEETIVFTYGYEDPKKPIPPGGSRVTVTLEDAPDGTRVVLQHAFSDSATRDTHVPGWSYQLAVFANVVAQEQHKGAEAAVDTWFQAWSLTDSKEQAAALDAVTTPGVRFRDAFACTEGRGQLLAHLVALRKHVPAITLQREGAVSHCQGTVLVRWCSVAPDGTEQRGTNVVELDPGGKIDSVVGFWG